MPQLLTLRIADILLLEDNPRTIADTEFAKLVIDIRDDPNFLLQRPPLINHNEQGQYVCYAGNQRVQACKHLGMHEVQCFVEEDVPLEVQRKRTIIDNTHRGKWDLDVIANEWSDLPLLDWAADIPFLKQVENINKVNNSESKEWVGMPEFEKKEEPLRIIISFDTEEQRQQFADLNELLFMFKKARSWAAWWPAKSRDDLASLKFEAGEEADKQEASTDEA